MKKNIILLALSICLFATSKLNAQSQSTNKTKFSIEIDPTTFAAFNGYGVYGKVQLKNTKHWILGGGVYGLDLPKPLIDINADNKDKGWKTRINSAYLIFGEYYFKEPNNKWFAVLNLDIQNFKITNDNIADKASTYSSFLVLPAIGYVWKPFKGNNFYIKPWGGLGYTTKISGDNTINNLTYKISSLVPFATLHFGYTF